MIALAWSCASTRADGPRNVASGGTSSTSGGMGTTSGGSGGQPNAGGSGGLAGTGASDPSNWVYTYGPAEGESATASVTPLMYGKAWAYTVEVDDGPKTTLTAAQPLFADYAWTDAPPGVAGGSEHPFVGSAAVFGLRIEGNDSFLSWADLKTLLDAGWGIANHSYWHSGDHQNPDNKLSPTQFRRELFWSQQLLGMRVFDGTTTPRHFVYPNGDYNYGDYLAEFGLRSGSLVSGASSHLDAATNLKSLNRNNLDENSWVGGGADPMYGIPEGGPAPGDFIIDFAHGIDGPGTDNHARWQQRLQTLEDEYGASGSDEMWSATSEAIVAYHLAAQQAEVSLQQGRLEVSLPAGAPRTALTVRLENVDPASDLPTPEGGVIYRSGTTVWITTPSLGAYGGPVPEPKLRLAHSMTFAPHIELPSATRFAAIRINAFGEHPPDYELSIELTLANETKVSLPVSDVLDQSPLGLAWGVWYNFPLLPDQDAIDNVVAIDISDNPIFKQVEIYALD